MNLPRLRFKEFSDEWDLKEIDEIATVSSGGTPSRTNQEFWNGEIPWVTTSEVKFNIIRDTEQKITLKGLKSSSAKMFPKDTLLIAMYGQGKTRGQIAKLEIEASTNQACAAILLKKPHNSDFFFQYLQNQYVNIRNLSNDGGQKNLSASLIKTITVAFPSSPEQTKIANFLTAVDEKIAQLTQKSNLLARYKKGVMQQIFSQQLRFKDDDGREFPDWEKKHFGEIATFSKGKGISKADIDENGKTLCIRYGELYTEYKETIRNIKSKTNISIYSLVLSEVNDVIIPASGETQIDIATASCVQIAGVALGGDLNIIKSQENGVFLAYYLNNKKKLDIGDSTGHCNTAEIVCEGDKKFKVFLGRSFNSSAMILSCSCV